MPPEDKDILQTKHATTFEQKTTDKEYWTKLIMEFNQAGELALRGMGLKEINSMVYDKNNLKSLNFSNNQIK